MTYNKKDNYRNEYAFTPLIKIMTFNFYDTPPQEIFDDVKEQAIEIRKTYDDTYGYATEKTDRVKNIQNIRDNIRYIRGMFDVNNQSRCYERLQPESQKLINDMLISQGHLPHKGFTSL